MRGLKRKSGGEGGGGHEKIHTPRKASVALTSSKRITFDKSNALPHERTHTHTEGGMTPIAGFAASSPSRPPILAPSLDQAANILHSASRLLIFTGAGMSADSGISTFRKDKNSFWGGIGGGMALAYFGTQVGWTLTPGLAWAKYVDMFLTPIAVARPHEGHYALVALVEERKEKTEGGRDVGRGREGEVKVITMNVDDLHERAGGTGWEEEGKSETEKNWRRVVHLHGSVGRNICAKHGLLSGLPYFPRKEERCEGQNRGSSVGETRGKSASDSEVKQVLNEYKRFRCPSCHRAPRPDIVLFGESLPQDEFSLATRAIDRLNPATNDALLVIGTTGGVYPAASLPERALMRGVRIIEVNMHPSPISEAADVFLQGRAKEVLPALLERVREKREKEKKGEER